MKQVYVEQLINADTPLAHEYDIIDDFTDLILKTSDNNEWSENHKNKQVARLNDTGEGLEIKLEGLKTIKLDYRQALELQILLSLTNDTRVEVRESILVKAIV